MLIDEALEFILAVRLSLMRIVNHVWTFCMAPIVRPAMSELTSNQAFSKS